MKSLRDEIRLRREIGTDLISSAKQISSERSEDFIAPRAISLKSNMIYDIIIVKEGAFMSNRFHVVKKYIDQMDYYGLLASGAPSDEFDIESKEISARISDDRSAQDIAEIIASVFNEYFDEHDDATVFLAVAKQIEKELLK